MRWKIGENRPSGLSLFLCEAEKRKKWPFKLCFLAVFLKVLASFEAGLFKIWLCELKESKRNAAIGIPLTAFKRRRTRGDILSDHQSGDCVEMQIKFVLPILDYRAADYEEKCKLNTFFSRCRETALCHWDIVSVPTLPATSLVSAGRLTFKTRKPQRLLSLQKNVHNILCYNLWEVTRQLYALLIGDKMTFCAVELPGILSGLGGIL